MVKVTAADGCGNAPKQRFVLEFMVAVVNGDVDQARSMVSADVTFDVVGRGSYAGKAGITDVLHELDARSRIDELKVLNAISHGKWCAANGTVSHADGRVIAFNNMFTFNNHGKNAVLQWVKVYAVDDAAAAER